MSTAPLAAGTILILLATGGAGAVGQSPQDLVDRAEADFAAGRIAEAVADYDRLRTLVPSSAPFLWERGIGLYELGRYEDCAAQFASYYELNSTDVENAVWHFLCVARATSFDAARTAILRAGPDRRIMRPEIYELFRGTLAPGDVLETAAAAGPEARFYAHLYVALYSEVRGDATGALSHMTSAASDEYRSIGGFMNVVARIHLAGLRAKRDGLNDAP
jgi:lipoprotein NlpI